MQTENPVIVTEMDSDGNESTFEITTEANGDADGEGTLLENVVEAIFDDSEPTDTITAEFIDTDGDGKIDAALADTDGDGEVDMAVVDTDGDGNLDTGVADTDGDGKIDMVSVDSDGDGMLDTAGMDTDGDGEIDVVAMDTDGDGKLDTAYSDTDGDGVADTVMRDADGDGEFELTEEIDAEASFTEEASAALPTEQEIGTNSVEFNLGSEAFADSPITTQDSSDAYYAAEPGFTSANDVTFTDPSADPAAAEQQANADAAREAQTAADDFVAAGDYRAAADAQAEAEALSGEAGDSSMLGAYDAQDYSYAADKQDQAAEYQAEQAEMIAAGDTEGAKEAAFNAEWATRDADMSAGGSDHTGQAQSDQDNLEWSTYHQDIADDNARSAEVYAAEGDMEKADMYAENAADHQSVAGDYAEQADPNSIMQDVDHSSVVDSGGTYDAGTYDVAAVDTGFDSAVDTAPSTYDTTSDDTL